MHTLEIYSKEFLNENSEIVKDFLESLYFCIDNGCKFELDFAQYILQNFEFVSKGYLESITATYIRNDIYDDKLYTATINHLLYKNISKETIIGLIKYPKLEEILSFTSILNGYELNLNKDFKSIVILFDYYNLPNGTSTKNVTDTRSYLFRRLQYRCEDIDPNSFCIPPGEPQNIPKIEKILFDTYLEHNQKEAHLTKSLDHKVIINDIRYAIRAYEERKFIDHCVSKFVMVAPDLA